MVILKVTAICLVFGVGIILAPVVKELKPPDIKDFLKRLFNYLLKKVELLLAGRKKKFEDQLPEVLENFAGMLETGASVFQAISRISEKAAFPVSDEFKIVLNEIKIGRSFEEAFLNLEKRVKCEDLSVVTTAIEVSRVTGASLSEIFKKVALTVREKKKIAEKIKVFTAQGRAQAIIIGLLPIFLILLILIVDPEFILPLFVTAQGLVMLAVAIVMEIAGIVTIRKIVKIEI